MPSADRIELPKPTSVDSDAMALNKRQMCDEIESEISSEKPEEVQKRPKKIFRRAEPVQAVNLSNL